MNILIMLMAALVLVVAGCGKRTAAPALITDTPEYHYKTGLQYADTDRIDEALKSFDHAVSLDPASPLGYIGRGLALGKKGDYKPAFKNMSRAKSLDKGIEANIGMMRLFCMQRTEGWIKEAEDEFKAAKKKYPDSAGLHYYMGMAYKVDLDFDKAADLFKTVLDMNREFTGEANTEWALIRKVQRAAPGTETGKGIALIDTIDRADIAALFDQEMDLEKLFTTRGVKTSDSSFKAPMESSTALLAEKVITMEAATDIADHWLKQSIETALKLKIRGLETGPNRTFQPDKLITRAEFALMLEDILIKVSGDGNLATKFLGATSPFLDVRNDQYFFNASMTATSRGFMEADKATGEFRPGGPVSGVDALLSIREFKNQLKW